jgi:hypothetical protein
MIVTGMEMDFNQLEQEIFRKCLELGRRIIAAVLKEWDEELRESREKEKYRNKGQRRTSIKTILGEVEYERTVYEVWEDGIKTGHVYLLDEALGEIGIRRMSVMLSGLIIKSSCEGAYRHAARAVSEMTGQQLSHTTIWKVVQTLGGRLLEEESGLAELASKSEGSGTLETKILFEEQDGVMIKLQGKSREEYGKSKEMKVAIAYDGAKKVGKKDRYELTNKVACASFAEASTFVKLKEGVIAGAYNVDEIEMRILGADGASWARRSQTDESVHFQLDPYHRNKAILRSISDTETRRNILQLLYTKQIDLMIDVIEAYSNSIEDAGEVEKCRELYNYFTNNKDGLISYKRRGIALPDPPEGKKYLNLGAMESNVFTLIGNRMKGNRCLWSINGGNRLAGLLCLYHTKRLGGFLENLGSCVLPERYEEEVEVRMSAAKVPMREGKGYDAHHKFTVPSSMKWLREIARIRTVLSH